MIKDLLGKIAVSKKVKVLPVKNRETPNLINGSTYYISFGSNDAYPCKLLEVLNEFNTPEVRIEILTKPKSSKGFIDINGTRIHHWAQQHLIYAFEIGSTPEEAVKNTVT